MTAPTIKTPMRKLARGPGEIYSIAELIQLDFMDPKEAEAFMNVKAEEAKVRLAKSKAERVIEKATEFNTHHKPEYEYDETCVYLQKFAAKPIWLFLGQGEFGTELKALGRSKLIKREFKAITAKGPAFRNKLVEIMRATGRDDLRLEDIYCEIELEEDKILFEKIARRLDDKSKKPLPHYFGGNELDIIWYAEREKNVITVVIPCNEPSTPKVLPRKAKVLPRKPLKHRPTVVRLTCAADIEPEPIQWLWDGWLAKGKFHILAGEAGTGKKLR